MDTKRKKWPSLGGVLAEAFGEPQPIGKSLGGLGGPVGLPDSDRTENEVTEESEAHADAEQRRAHENQNQNFRKWALILLFAYTCVWSICMWVSLWCCELSDAVLITLFTTSLTQVLGLTLIALNWLFPNWTKPKK